MIKYVTERPAIELPLATSAAERSGLEGRLTIERNTAFKCADLLYALGMAPAACQGREQLVADLLERISQGVLPGGGWAADMRPDSTLDTLATAGLVRAQHAVGTSIADSAVAILDREVRSPGELSAYERVYCLLVLTEIGRGDSPELAVTWKKLLVELGPQLREPAEVNHNFQLGDRFQYVGLPWQLHLLSCAALRRPRLIFLNRDLHNLLLGTIQRLHTATGYGYPQTSSMRSTRTYGVLMDTYWRIDQAIAGARYLAPLSALTNGLVRIAYSRLATWTALLGAGVLAAVAVHTWLTGTNGPIAAIGPGLGAAGLMATLSFLLRRVRRRG